jgi:hypothetical protein
VELYGLGLYNFDTMRTTGVTPDMRAKLRLVHEDAEVRIFENRDAFPRAYVVPSGRFAQGDDPLSEMLDLPFDPRQEVLLEQESAFDPQLLWDRDRSRARRESAPQAGQSPNEPPRPLADAPNPPAARPLITEPDRVVYRASAPEGGYFVHVANLASGWRAWVDGAEAPLYRANHLFRAVPLPPGEHEVELRYEPGAVALGRMVSAWATVAAAASLLLAAVWGVLQAARRDTPA